MTWYQWFGIGTLVAEVVVPWAWAARHPDPEHQEYGLSGRCWCGEGHNGTRAY